MPNLALALLGTLYIDKIWMELIKIGEYLFIYYAFFLPLPQANQYRFPPPPALWADIYNPGANIIFPDRS